MARTEGSHATSLPEKDDQISALKKALFMCAASCQGGHSDAGAAAAEVLGVPFPLRMEALERKAEADGFNTQELWPWLYRMRAQKSPSTQRGEGRGEGA
jgi:hypothetical protein